MRLFSAAKSFSPWHSFNEFFVSIVYFVQGSAGLTGIAASLILREQLGLDFYQIGLIAAATTIPWSIKPVFGLLTDLVPIGKFRRRPYLHIGPLIGFLGYLLVGLYGHSFESFFFFLVIANLGLSLTDVATDGFVVEESTEDNAARIQGITQASIRTAAFVTSFFSGLLIFAEIFTPHQMYLILACFPLITFIASWFIRETPADSLHLTEQDGEDSISTESSLEQRATKKLDLSIFTPSYLISLLVIFVGIMVNMLFSGDIAEWLAINAPSIKASYLTAALWALFGAWMLSYFHKLRKLKLTSSMIFLAILFILLWRINPDTGSSMFFYVRDYLGIDEKTLGYVDTLSQLGSILGVILAVKLFDKIELKKVLLITVILGAGFTFSNFFITRPLLGEAMGANALFGNLGSLAALPIYFFDSLFGWLFTGASFANPWTTASSLSPMAKFLFLQSAFSELFFMIAYIPLLKFAVLITPSKAEATNFAIIASVMNIGLALSKWLSGLFYNGFMSRMHPDLAITAIQVDVIELLICINILSTMTCLIVLPFLKTDRFEKLKHSS